MAYFSNGSEGMWADEEFCSKCVHMPEDPDEGGCPAWLLHMLWNYGQCNEDDVGKAKKMALNILWPSNEKGENQDCAMFVKREGGA